MDRLTELPNNNSIWRIKKCAQYGCGNICDNVGGCLECPIQEAVAKLAEYEDLEEMGLLLRLPVAVGDMVYVINKGEIAKAKVYDIQFRGIKYKEGQRFWMNIGANVYFEQDFEKTVFYTLELAEAKLREMEGAE